MWKPVKTQGKRVRVKAIKNKIKSDAGSIEKNRSIYILQMEIFYQISQKLRYVSFMFKANFIHNLLNWYIHMYLYCQLPLSFSINITCLDRLTLFHCWPSPTD